MSIEMKYLDFEEPLQLLDDKLSKALEKNESAEKIEAIHQEIEKAKKSVYGNLTPWQRVCLSRHPDRPYALDYIGALTGDTFIELYGDRNAKDDKTMVGGLGKIGDQSYMFIGQQKGRDMQSKEKRRYGMASPEGYRKALRLMKLAEKFDIPVVMFVDTPGAYPSIEAEKGGQAEAIARNIFEQIKLKVPTMSIIIGEGASGGALGICVADKVLMMENAWYSVISPESCSSILWRTVDFKETAAEKLKLCSEDMQQCNFVDGVIKEPECGAHRDWEKIFKTVRSLIEKEFQTLSKKPIEKLLTERKEKYFAMSVFKEN